MLYVPAGKNKILLARASSWSVSEYSSSRALCIATTSAVEPSPIAPKALTETWSSNVACNVLLTSPDAPVLIGVESPR